MMFFILYNRSFKESIGLFYKSKGSQDVKLKNDKKPHILELFLLVYF